MLYFIRVCLFCHPCILPILFKENHFIFLFFLLIELVNIYNWIHLDEKGKVAQSNVIYVSLIHFLETSFGFFCALVTAWTVSKQRCRTRQCKRSGRDVSRSNDGMTQSRKPIQTSFQEDHFAFVHVWASKWYLINNASKYPWPSGLICAWNTAAWGSKQCF